MVHATCFLCGAPGHCFDNIRQGEKAKFCSLHKSTTMIDVRSRRCAASECKRQPSYGFEGKRACFCAAHKSQGMVDVVSRRCEERNCRRRPLYGYEVSGGECARLATSLAAAGGGAV